MQTLEKPNFKKIKEISFDITTSMLKRAYPAVNGAHFFKKYTVDGKLDPNFLYALCMMNDKVLRIDIDETIASTVTFVLLENGKPKMHHMIDDDYESKTFGAMMNDPYEGQLKRQTCYKHLENGFTEGCNKCILERETQICLKHNRALSRCDKCENTTELIKEQVTKEEAEKYINTKLKIYKKEYWSDSSHE